MPKLSPIGVSLLLSSIILAIPRILLLLEADRLVVSSFLTSNCPSNSLRLDFNSSIYSSDNSSLLASFTALSTSMAIINSSLLATLISSFAICISTDLENSSTSSNDL
eukprot:NODE_273_length_12179_cov_0.492632.p8 type:complete len:108 gc:universal NODE_273_length_12179_cov_0.492632:7963-7640(-)